MNTKIMTEAISKIDDELIEQHLSEKKALGTKKSSQRKPKWPGWGTIAVCLALVLCMIPVAKLIFGGANSGNPVFFQYETFEEMKAIVGDGLLFDNLESSDAEVVLLQLDFNRGKDGVSPEGKPRVLHVRQNYRSDKITDRVHLYIFFDRDTTDSMIAGYEEQGLTKTINGITVQYSNIEDPNKHSQARFLYGGNLYVLDIDSSGSEWRLDRYLNALLDGKSEHGSDGDLESSSSTELRNLTENELFSYPNLCAFKGEIIDIQTHYIGSKDTNSWDCFSVIYVKAEKAFKGTFKEGDIIRMDAGVPILTEGVYVGDSSTIVEARIGQKAIFTPICSTDNEYADCSLGDGIRWAFLETEKGLVFSREAYLGAKDAQTLDDIEAYIVERLRK